MKIEKLPSGSCRIRKMFKNGRVGIRLRHEICIQAFYDRQGRKYQKRSGRKNEKCPFFLTTYDKSLTKKVIYLINNVYKIQINKRIKKAANP